jgi:hypothetical protein
MGSPCVIFNLRRPIFSGCLQIAQPSWFVYPYMILAGIRIRETGAPEKKFGAAA